MQSSNELFNRIDRPRLLPDVMAVSIIGAIEGGPLLPGDRLAIKAELPQRFGVARTVVRKAISLLRYDGIVELRRSVRVFVSDASQRSAVRISPACFEKRRQIIQLLQLRTGVRAGATALAAGTGTTGQMEKSTPHSCAWPLPMTAVRRMRGRCGRCAYCDPYPV